MRASEPKSASAVLVEFCVCGCDSSGGGCGSGCGQRVMMDKQK